MMSLILATSMTLSAVWTIAGIVCIVYMLSSKEKGESDEDDDAR